MDGRRAPGAGRRVVDLRAAPLLLPAYVELRNRWREALLTGEVTVAGTRAWLAAADAEVRCLEEDGRLLGAAVLYPSREGEIAVFAATPGRGAGGTLLAQIETVARGRGLPSVRARVRADNPAGLAAFRRASYAEAGRGSESRDGAPVELVLFRKRLAP